jgi:hypothetical protein
MNLQEWIDQHPEVDDKIAAAVNANETFGVHVRSFKSDMVNDEPRLQAWKDEQRRLFDLLEIAENAAEQHMISLDRVKAVRYGVEVIPVDKIELLGWEFEVDFWKEPMGGHLAFLKFKMKDETSSSTQRKRALEVELNDEIKSQ